MAVLISTGGDSLQGKQPVWVKVLGVDVVLLVESSQAEPQGEHYSSDASAADRIKATAELKWTPGRLNIVLTVMIPLESLILSYGRDASEQTGQKKGLYSKQFVV